MNLVLSLSKFLHYAIFWECIHNLFSVQQIITKYVFIYNIYHTKSVFKCDKKEKGWPTWDKKENNLLTYDTKEIIFPICDIKKKWLKTCDKKIMFADMQHKISTCDREDVCFLTCNTKQKCFLTCSTKEKCFLMYDT